MKASPLGSYEVLWPSGCTKSSPKHWHGPHWRHFALGLLLILLAAPGISRADTYCTNTGTHIITYSPQAGIPGVTRIYIKGACFGATQGLGSVTVGGATVPASGILVWSGGEIVVVVPDTAQTGDIEVDTQYGSDTSVNAANDPAWNWQGNGQIMNNGIFNITVPNNPQTPSSKIEPTGPSVPQYVEGVWNYYDGSWYGDHAQYTLSQNLSSISGSFNWWDDWGDSCSGPLTGSLNNALLTLNVVDNTNGCDWSEEWLVLNSGDVTSQGFWPIVTGCTPPTNFPVDADNSDSGDWWCWDVPLFKSQTDIPSTETPLFRGWIPIELSLFDTTVGAWARILPVTADGLTAFPGRFVYEQNAQPAFDGCWAEALDLGFTPYEMHRAGFFQTTGVSGGGWYVDSFGNWGTNPDLLWADDIGARNYVVDWLQSNGVTPCTVTVYQQMFIDTISGPVTYNTNTLKAEIDSWRVWSTVNNSAFWEQYP